MNFKVGDRVIYKNRQELVGTVTSITFSNHTKPYMDGRPIEITWDNREEKFYYSFDGEGKVEKYVRKLTKLDKVLK